MGASLRRVRPEWARRLRRTRRRRIFWSTASLLMFGGAAIGGFLWTVHDSAGLERSRQVIVLGVMGVGLMTATVDILHPIHPKGPWLGVGVIAPLVFLPLVGGAVILHPDMSQLMRSIFLAVFTSQVGGIALACGIGVVRDVRDTTGIRG